jgi:hypothetical protein
VLVAGSWIRVKKGVKGGRCAGGSCSASSGCGWDWLGRMDEEVVWRRGDGLIVLLWVFWEGDVIEDEGVGGMGSLIWGGSVSIFVEGVGPPEWVCEGGSFPGVGGYGIDGDVDIFSIIIACCEELQRGDGR